MDILNDMIPAIIIVTAAAIPSINPLVFAQTESNPVKTLRIGYFPNINHAQAVIGFGNGDFQKALGNNIIPIMMRMLLNQSVKLLLSKSNIVKKGY